MRALATVLTLLAANALATAPAVAESVRTKSSYDPQRFMRVYGIALPPYGFVEFCERTPRECAQHTVDDQRFVATPARLRELDEVNRSVNKAVAPATDQELYSVTEHWTLPGIKGDCEDYALLKRQILMRRGWPASALLITVVRDEKGEGHAILTARTSTGDMILDNKTDDLKVWHRTPYQFVMRQSYLNPRVWMSLDARDAASPSALAGVPGFR